MGLSERMIKARKNKGLTLQAVSEAVQVEKETVMAWEAGTAIPDAHEVASLCEVLHVSADELLFEKPPVPPTNPKPLSVRDVFRATALAIIAVPTTALFIVWLIANMFVG